MDASVAIRGLPAVEGNDRADLGDDRLSEDRLSGRALLRGAKGRREVQVYRGCAAGDSRHLYKARHSAEGAGGAARCRRRDGDGGSGARDAPCCRRRGLRQRKRCDHLPRRADEGWRDLHVDLRGDPGISGPDQEIPRQRRARDGQLLCDVELGRVFGRDVCLRTEGRSLPDGVVHLLPDECEGHGTVRANADHRR